MVLPTPSLISLSLFPLHCLKPRSLAELLSLLYFPHTTHCQILSSTFETAPEPNHFTPLRGHHPWSSHHHLPLGVSLLGSRLPAVPLIICFPQGREKDVFKIFSHEMLLLKSFNAPGIKSQLFCPCPPLLSLLFGSDSSYSSHAGHLSCS